MTDSRSTNLSIRWRTTNTYWFRSVNLFAGLNDFAILYAYDFWFQLQERSECTFKQKVCYVYILLIFLNFSFEARATGCFLSLDTSLVGITIFPSEAGVVWIAWIAFKSFLNCPVFKMWTCLHACRWGLLGGVSGGRGDIDGWGTTSMSAMISGNSSRLIL